MTKRPGDQATVRVINNFPGRYPVEDWRVYYWVVDSQGNLLDRHVTIQLPAGYSEACAQVSLGESGCIYKVRRWGLACYPSLLERIGFDPYPLLTRDPERFPGGEDQELLHIYLAVTHFDLPGHFIIADPVYPLLLFDPQGDLKGSWLWGPTYAGALAWMASGGKVRATFEQVRRLEPDLYAEVVGILRKMLQARRRRHPPLAE